MKLITEMDSNFGIKIDTEGKVPLSLAIGMVECTRNLLRADLVKAHYTPISEPAK
jgi:hypothetical protein